MSLFASERGAIGMTDDAYAGQGATFHDPAMVPQILDLLQPQPGQVALDLTLGTAGHSCALSEAVGPDGLLIGIDADPRTLPTAHERLTELGACPFKLYAMPFSRAPEAVRSAGASRVDVALADLGVGTHQLDDPERGFGFESKVRLDMRYDPDSHPSAWEVVNRAEEADLAEIFHRLGEERYSRQIAARICHERRQAPIDTPAEFADLVKRVVARRSRPGRTWRIHPATRVMMALRIHVNREMDELEALLRMLPEMLNASSRAAVLTYHSLEARRVKQAWRAQARAGLVELLTSSPVRPTAEQVSRNPRIRSAQLRGIRRL